MELRFSVAFPFTSTALPAAVLRSLKICTYYAELKHFFMATLCRDNATIGRNDGDARKIYVDKRPAAPPKSVGCADCRAIQMRRRYRFSPSAHCAHGGGSICCWPETVMIFRGFFATHNLVGVTGSNQPAALLVSWLKFYMSCVLLSVFG